MNYKQQQYAFAYHFDRSIKIKFKIIKTSEYHVRKHINLLLGMTSAGFLFIIVSKFWVAKKKRLVEGSPFKASNDEIYEAYTVGNY